MEKIITAEQIISKLNKSTKWDEWIEGYIFDAQENVIKTMIDFAKQHVKFALDDIYERAKHGDEEHQRWLKEFFDTYPLKNIK